MGSQSHFKSQRDAPNRFRDAERGSTCARADMFHHWLLYNTKLVGILPYTKFQCNPLSRSLSKKKGYVHSGMHMQLTHDLSNMHYCLVPKRIPNFVTIGKTIPELNLSDQF